MLPDDCDLVWGGATKLASYYYLISLLSGSGPLRRIHHPRDAEILRLDLQHDHRRSGGQSGLLHRLPDATRRRQASQNPQRGATEEGVPGRHATARTGVADPGRANGGGGSLAEDEHLEPPGGDNQEREDDRYHHHALH